MDAKDLIQFMQILNKPMGFGEDYEANNSKLWTRLDDCGIIDIQPIAKTEKELKNPKISIWEVAKLLVKRVVLERVSERSDQNKKCSKRGRSANDWSLSELLIAQQMIRRSVNDWLLSKQ